MESVSNFSWKNKIWKTGILSAIAASCALLLFTVLLDYFGENPFGRYKYSYIGLYALFIGGGMILFREYLNNRILGARQAIFIGLIVTVFTSLGLYPLFLYTFLSIQGENGSAITKHKADLVELIERDRDGFVEGQGGLVYDAILNDIENKDSIQVFEANKESFVKESGAKIYDETLVNITKLQAGDLVPKEVITLLFLGIFNTMLLMLLLKTHTGKPAVLENKTKE